MSARQILEAFSRWRAASIPLALVTVVETEGSTYTKPGHRILIAESGEFQGLVSGGCLEGDLAEHARQVLEHGHARLVTYDLRGENDELFGLGIGCEGMFRILLQPLLPGEGYAPFATIAERMTGDTACTTATVADSTDPDLAVGATLVSGGDQPFCWRVPEGWRQHLASGCLQQTAVPALVSQKLAGRQARVLYAPLHTLPRLLVLGAGLDAVPLLDIAVRLGWRITVADHRPAYLARGDLGAAERVIEVAPSALNQAVMLPQYSAAIVMSHHLQSDRAYLAVLAASNVPYVGLLGPAARRDRLLADLGTEAGRLQERLHAPVGLRIGADSPETIALAVMAEIQASLAGRLDLLPAER